MAIIEYSDRQRSASDVLSGLAKAAGMTTDELMDDVRTGGQDAAFRRAAGRAERRKQDPHRRQVELLRRREVA